MGIARTLGATAKNTTATTTLAFAAASQTNGQKIVVAVSIALGSGASVSGISDGTNTYTLQSAQSYNGTVRAEVWVATVTGATASRTITITFSASTLAAAAYEEVSGSTAIGNIAVAASGTGGPISINQALQDNGSWAMTAVAWVLASGDVPVNGVEGNWQQTVTSATVTTVGVGLVEIPCQFAITVAAMATIPAGKDWVAVSIELRTGVAPLTIGPSKGSSHTHLGTNWRKTSAEYTVTGATPVPVAQVLQGGTLGIAYTETISTQGGASPYSYTVISGALPSGTSLNSSTGVISGTPTAIGTYNFMIKVTDANGSTGTQAFQIVIANPPSGGNYCIIY